jgi:hypothetical protein
MPKTGTHSLAGIFGRYRARHEPEQERVMRFIMARARQELSTADARNQIRLLDRRLWLEFSVSWINYFLVDLLLEEFPKAKFVLTIRDCYSWMDSMFNQLLAREHNAELTQFHHWYADSLGPASHSDGDRVLAEHGLWPVELWLRAWVQHNSRILELVPADRLLIIRTHEILPDIRRLAEFFEVPPDTLEATRSHDYKAEKKFGLLSKIDEHHLLALVESHCADLMGRFFPEIRRPADVIGHRPTGHMD